MNDSPLGMTRQALTLKRKLSFLGRLTDQELLQRVQDLARVESRAMALLVAHLAELDVRQLYLGQGHPSLFSYCTHVLNMSERAAYKRIAAARAALRFPAILERLADGSVHLSGVLLIAPLLDEENHLDLLNQASHKRCREIQELVARARPLPPVPAFVRKLPGKDLSLITEVTNIVLNSNGQVDERPFASEEPLLAAAPPSSAAQSGENCESCESLSGVVANSPPENSRPGRGIATTATPTAATEHASSPQAAADRHNQGATTAGECRTHSVATLTPLSPQHYKLQVTLRAETHRRLRQAQELLRHQIPGGDLAEVLHKALELLVFRLCQRKFAATRRSWKEGDLP